MHYVDPADFRLLGGEDHLLTYRFGTRTTAHHFCKICGVFPFFWSNWGGKEHWAINVAWLDGVDPYEQTTRLIDGRSS